MYRILSSLTQRNRNTKLPALIRSRYLLKTQLVCEEIRYRLGDFYSKFFATRTLCSASSLPTTHCGLLMTRIKLYNLVNRNKIGGKVRVIIAAHYSCEAMSCKNAFYGVQTLLAVLK